MKKEQFLFRFLMTGAYAVILTGASFAVAGAAETAHPTALTVATAAADAAPATQAQLIQSAAVEAAAPTGGADLAMWGVEPTAKDTGNPAETRIAGSRLVRRFTDGIVHRTSTLAVNLTRNAMRFLGVPYVFGGTSVHGFDCSGFVQHVFAMLGRSIPRTADAQYYAGKKIAGGARRMVAGDLVFFQTYTPGPSHVGIYLGNDRFVHASSSHGVMVSSLHDRYWSARYLGAKRLI
jgi:cell wall-associated NlpC family hydrolase